MFQDHVNNWARVCLGRKSLLDKRERNFRFIEESLELAQAAGLSKDDALRLVDYVYNRPPGEVAQEVGGVAVTLCALCTAHGVDTQQAARTELARIETRVDEIREKQRGKPR